ncbi:glycosyltransferase [Vibrio astriarenae]
MKRIQDSLSQIAAVVVFYHPSANAIEHAIWLSQQLSLVVVDNTEASQVQATLEAQGVAVIANHANLGVSKALNQGIDYWQQQGKSWCFLFDQDSQIDTEFIHTMLEPLAKPEPTHKKVAAYVPSYFAENLGTYGAIIQVDRYRIRRWQPKQANLQQRWASYAINSGSLVNLKHVNQIGPFHEGLFIDFSDIEWGLRANHLGYGIFTVTEATLIQQLGDKPIELWGKRIVNHSPLRHYYYIRNVIHMLRLRHVPTIWKWVEVTKLPIRFVLYSSMTQNRIRHFKSMCYGLIDGLKNKQGKYCESTRNR